jgi:hypothetical protein
VALTTSKQSAGVLTQMRSLCFRYLQIFTKRFASGGNASEAPASNLGQQTYYTDLSFLGFLQLLRAESGMYLMLRPRPVSFTSRFIINRHPIIDHTYSVAKIIVKQTVASFQFSFVANPSLSAG